MKEMPPPSGFRRNGGEMEMHQLFHRQHLATSPPSSGYIIPAPWASGLKFVAGSYSSAVANLNIDESDGENQIERRRRRPPT